MIVFCRLLVAVLEAFHFDLSSSEHVPQAQPEFTSPEMDQAQDESVEEKKDSEEKGGNGMDIDNDEDEDKEAEDEEIEGSNVAENNAEQATRIHKTILNSVIPKLLEIFSERVRYFSYFSIPLDFKQSFWLCLVWCAFLFL